MKKPQLLWLIWQNNDTRQRYHIGNLIYQDGLFMFQYEFCSKNRCLQEALENGYTPHLAFPELKMIYTSSNLFGPFARRLPSKSRPDYSKLLTKFGLNEDSTEMEFLSVTGGKLATDPYEFANPIYVEDGRLTLGFYIAGWSHYGGDEVIHQLKVGDSLNLNPDPENPKDRFAIKILTSDNRLLGFVPAFYSEALSVASISKAIITNIDSDAISQLKIKIKVEGTLEQKNIKDSNFNYNNLLPVYYTE